MKGNSEMTASHNNSKPAQIWIKSVPHVITFVSTLTVAIPAFATGWRQTTTDVLCLKKRKRVTLSRFRITFSVDDSYYGLHPSQETFICKAHTKPHIIYRNSKCLLFSLC